MDVKNAVIKAIEYISDIFMSEKLENIGLEEVSLDEHKNIWEVTIGFSRPWDYPKSNIITGLKTMNPKRQYKVVRIDNTTEQIKSVKIRNI